MDVAANRSARKWSFPELVGRVLWALARVVFAWSPRPLWGWRCLLLRLFGARIGHGVHIYPSVRITIPWNLTVGDQTAIGDRAILYALGPITLAERVTVSQGAHLCAGTHDHRDPTMPLLKPPIVVDRDSWICADAFVGPGVRVGSRAIIGARCVVMKDVEPGSIMIGNPAKLLHRREEGDDVENA
ncbi:colanic acid biosynthesis acetyltransferase WcaF [Mesorhizobium sp.]|uniref:colanic acid biosynthesis acetyltransferase WcaF n=1 Tax=Mesorhizobium sp. TaxID=1871066 RepID=UPI00257D830D|nr:colanic acid biosynthesis acetyltransferase WcaF [Mesorhizobium sp.]